MAGSYKHVVTDGGALRVDTFTDMIENLGDAWEAIEEMYGMIWHLAEGNPARVLVAAHEYREGIKLSPGYGDDSVFYIMPIFNPPASMGMRYEKRNV